MRQRIVAVAVLLLAGPAVAQSVGSQVEAVVARLDSDAYAERESASVALLQIDGISHVDVEPWLSREGLSPEQRARLERAGFQLFLQGGRPGLGVGFASNEPVELRNVVEGFDAFERLRPGDVIVGVDGRGVLNIAGFRAEILSRLPGETMHLLVLRGGERREVAVRLGKYENLENSQGLDIASLASAWAWRLARLSLRAEAPPLDPLATEDAEQSPPPPGPPVERTALGRTPSLVVGGQPRVGSRPAGFVQSRRMPTQIAQVPRAVDANAQDVDERLAALLQTVERDIGRAQIRLSEALEAGNRDDAERIRLDLAALEARREIVKRQLDGR